VVVEISKMTREERIRKDEGGRDKKRGNSYFFHYLDVLV
jgi:hypothetical protein